MTEITLNQALTLALEKQKQGKLAEAENLYKKVLEKNPNNSDALHLLGLIYYQSERYEESISLIKEAIKLKSCAVYFGNLGMAYDKLGKEEDSMKSFKKALEIDSKYPGSHLAYYNLGTYLANSGKFIESLEHYTRAIEIDKNFFDAHWNQALILLTLERFEQGWKDYEYRLKKKSPVDTRVFDRPKWDGSYLGGKKILILSEQGFGDAIQFVRYLPLVKEKRGSVILECKKELKRLFENFPGVYKLIEKKNNTPPNINFDFYTYLMSLPGIFNTNTISIPNKIPYLKANPTLIEKFRNMFDTKDFKVGIVWAGNPAQENDKNRSTTFKRFEILTKIPNITLFSLQKGDASQQLNNSKLINLAGDIKDFSDTAAIIENLDLLISVDTSVAHLAGAMGKPVWVLLSKQADWRWFLNKDYSPWYPTMRLFRQKKLGGWDSLFKQVFYELKKLSSFKSTR